MKRKIRPSNIMKPVPVAVWSKGWVCGRFLAGIVGSHSTGGIDVSYERRVLSGGGLCDGLIARPEESF